MNKLHIVILAAGQGTRLKSKTPKVLHQLGGIPLLTHVINTAKQLSDNIHVIYGHQGEQLKQQITDQAIHWIEQKEQLGTAHAVRQALDHIESDTHILVLYGDVPLIQLDTLQGLTNIISENQLALLTANVKDPSGLGRIIRNQQNHITAIVEDKDANTAQRAINEINTGIMLGTTQCFKKYLAAINNNNKQQEYYLTDIVEQLVNDGSCVNSLCVDEVIQIQGVNDRWQLAELERHYQQQQAKQLALSGVTLGNYQTLTIRNAKLTIASDVFIDSHVLLQGEITIDADTSIGANVILRNVNIGKQVTILPNTIIEEAVIEDGCTVGPFARIRPRTHLKKQAKVGNFVEIKKTVLGENSKASHLTYLGDAVVGRAVNIGAGVITCNYDGKNKWQTQINDYAFIGSNVNLVAPITIGESATIGAGSTLSKDAPAKQLTVSRSKPISISGWKPTSEKEISK